MDLRKLFQNLAMIFWSTPVYAFPVLVNGQDVTLLLNSQRSHLIAVAPPNESNKEWRRVPLQQDEIEDEALIVFRTPDRTMPIRNELPRPSKKDPTRGQLREFHRLTTDDLDYGTCDAQCESMAHAEIKKVCGYDSNASLKAVKITLTYRKKSLYIANCRQEREELKKFVASVNLPKRTFTSDKFQYRFTGSKDILFEGISVGDHHDLIGPSEMKVYLKPKFFLNLEFGNKDLVSQITSITEGTQSLGIETAFSLNILNMKVNTQICCDLSIYQDAFYFPVVLDLPFEGKSFSKGSGLFYGFGFKGNWRQDINISAPAVGQKGDSDQTSSALLVKGENGNRIAVGFRSISDENGVRFIPTLATKDDLNKMNFPKVDGSFGLFYDVTNLKKGFHAFHIWFYVGKAHEEEILLEYAKNGILFTTKDL